MTAELPDRLQAVVGDAFSIEVEMHGGGMSRVFLAHEPALKRDVVIKVLPPDLVTTDSLERFRREIELTAQLQHPHILPVISAGRDGDLMYYVAPFVRGQSLRDRLAKAPRLSVDEAERLVGELLGAVAFAHARGVIHRDIKPANVLLFEGHAILADFGIARALANPDDDQVTASGTLIGTPAYMAPERPRDEQADLYGVAVMAYEMLAGAAPGDDRSRDTIAAALVAAAPREMAARARRIAVVLARALSPDPARRWRTAREFRDAFHGSLAATPRSSWWRVAVAAVVVAGAAVFGERELADRGAVSARSAALGRIVVAPLQNFTGTDSVGAVGMMAADWITDGLEKTGMVEVVPTTGAVPAFRYASRGGKNSSAQISPAVLAEETGAVTVVYGGVYRVRNRLDFRITVADQRGTRVAGTITDISAPVNDPILGVNELRTRVMGWLASHYDDRLTAFVASSVRPPTYDAYLAFNQGMDRYTSADYVAALPLFMRAAQLDSTFVVAQLYASISMTNLGKWMAADSLLGQVARHRDRLNAYHQAWLDYRIAFVRGDRERALTAIRSAYQLAPDSKAAYNLAVVEYQSGHLNDALATIEGIRPDRGAMRGFAPYWSLYGYILHALGRYNREQQIGVLARRAFPDRLSALSPSVRAFAATGQLAALRGLADAAPNLREDLGYWDLGHFYTEVGEELRAHGHPDEAQRYLEKARTWAQRHDVPRWRLVTTLYDVDEWALAQAVLVPLRQEAPDNVEYAGLTGLLAARRGATDAARAIGDSLARRRVPYDFGATAWYAAKIAAVLGDREGAIARLHEAYAEERSYDLSIHRDADFSSLLTIDGFQALLRGAR